MHPSSVTRFSIVLPVYNVRAYLEECIDSILDQSFGDFELIAVDDHTPDGSGEILDDYAARDPRVRVLHLPDNLGLGLAREAGMAAATGDYLLFVDSDDVMAPGTLAAISARIDATGRPDVVLFDYARIYWWREGFKRNQLAGLLAAPGPDVFTIRERPELLNLLMVVWNKAYRRDFVTAGGFHFSPGYYEDTPWTYPVLLAADSIAILDRVCIHYRQRRQGNILRSRSRKHFDIFDQWDRVYAFVDRHPELADWRGFLVRRELEHTATILESNRRLPTEARREFFHRAHDHYVQHRPAGKVAAGRGKSGISVTLTMRNWWLPYRLFAFVLRLLPVARRIAGAVWRRTPVLLRRARTLLFKVYYRLQLLLPMDGNLAVYAAYWYRGVLDNPAAIDAKARELAPHIKGVWVVKPAMRSRVPAGVDVVTSDSLAYFRTLARAKYFVNNANFPGFVRKRKGAVFLQTQHGTPLKKMGVELQDFPVGANRMDFVKLLDRVDRWDFNLSTNRFSTVVWERSFPATYETLEVGYPRNDELVNATAADMSAARARLQLADSARVVLYAPTFRDYRNDFSPEIDLAALVDAIGADGVLLVRAHYFHDVDDFDALAGLRATGRIVDVSAYPSVNDLLLAADALLTDYSSVMFDYALLDRPIAVYAYDWDTYRRTRGVNLDLLDEPPGFVAQTADDLLDGFRSGEVWGERAAKARAEFRRKFCEFDDGHAAERVVRRVFLDEPLPGPMESASTGVSGDTTHDDA